MEADMRAWESGGGHWRRVEGGARFSSILFWGLF